MTIDVREGARINSIVGAEGELPLNLRRRRRSHFRPLCNAGHQQRPHQVFPARHDTPVRRPRFTHERHVQADERSGMLQIAQLYPINCCCQSAKTRCCCTRPCSTQSRMPRSMSICRAEVIGVDQEARHVGSIDQKEAPHVHAGLRENQRTAMKSNRNRNRGHGRCISVLDDGSGQRSAMIVIHDDIRRAGRGLVSSTIMRYFPRIPSDERGLQPLLKKIAGNQIGKTSNHPFRRDQFPDEMSRTKAE